MNNIHAQQFTVSKEEREKNLQQKGKVLWFTGLSGSGKSTIANKLEQHLHQLGRATFVLDGDNMRTGLNKDLGFNDADRKENIRRIAEVAKLMKNAGLLVICSFISPFEKDRSFVRKTVGEENYLEFYVATDLATCEARDVKGLYAKARKGEIPNFTGISSPYEAPKNPFMKISTEEHTLEEIVQLIDEKIKNSIK